MGDRKAQDASLVGQSRQTTSALGLGGGGFNTNSNKSVPPPPPDLTLEMVSQAVDGELRLFYNESKGQPLSSHQMIGVHALIMRRIHTQLQPK
mgnify:CR=1 FL=1